MRCAKPCLRAVSLQFNQIQVQDLHAEMPKLPVIADAERETGAPGQSAGGGG
jgi:hypothetical protein